MKIAGVIAEYNPFHNGHAYHLQQIRAMGATHIVAVMSGNFVQRGTPALADKQLRTRAILQGGVDLVIELPLPYACSTAERFACGAVTLLDAMGCVDTLCFGSENGSIEPLLKMADLLESPQMAEALEHYLQEGISFAAARQKAAASFVGEEAARMLSSPNNILGVEYLRRLSLLGSRIVPQTILRKGIGHDQYLSDLSSSRFASGSQIRKLITAGQWEESSHFLPEYSLALLQNACQRGKLTDRTRLELILLARLRCMSIEELRILPDISEGLEYRVNAAIRTACTYDDLLEQLKTRRYPTARLRRILISALLGLQADDCHTPPPYLRVLGMNSRGKEILAKIKSAGRLPVSTSPARLEETSEAASRFVQLEALSTDLYQLLFSRPGGCGKDYTNKVVIL